MSLIHFQQAICQLIASPATCQSFAKNPILFFSNFDLTEKETKRLISIVSQKGMVANCNLYRFNKITPIYTQLQYTCLALGPKLVPIVDHFWQKSGPTNLQFKNEIQAFGMFFKKNYKDKLPEIDYVFDLLNFEMAINKLTYTSGRKTVSVNFKYNPDQLLPFIFENKKPDYLEKGIFSIKIQNNNGQIELV